MVHAFDATGAEIPRDGCIATATLPLARTRFAPIHPNPFNPRATISFELSAEGPVLVDIVDARGRQVRSLFQGALQQGPHELLWNGRDDGGKAMASGVYRVILSTEEGTQTRAAVLLK